MLSCVIKFSDTFVNEDVQYPFKVRSLNYVIETLKRLSMKLFSRDSLTKGLKPRKTQSEIRLSQTLMKISSHYSSNGKSVEDYTTDTNLKHFKLFINSGVILSNPSRT